MQAKPRTSELSCVRWDLQKTPEVSPFDPTHERMLGPAFPALQTPRTLHLPEGRKPGCLPPGSPVGLQPTL